MTIRCPKCQERLKTTGMGQLRKVLDEAMNTYTKARHCSCGYKTTTTELESAELSDLRRRAYLYDRSQA